MRNFIDELEVNGHLTIIKRYNDGIEEVIFDDHNIIVSGMGVGLTYLFTASGSNSILDYQIDRFQLGVSGGTALEVSTTNELSSGLTYAQYGAGSNLYIEDMNQMVGDYLFASACAIIPPNKITKIGEMSVRYTLVVDEEAANDLVGANAEEVYLSEIGLLMKNPKGNSPPNESILTAYRAFSNIRKTSDFSLIFRWTLNF